MSVEAGGPWWWWPAGTALTARPLLFFPPAGADQTIARPLVQALASRRLGVLRMPGRGARSDEAAPDRMIDLIGDIAASIADLPGPAPILVGHSFGGLLAYGTAHALQAMGRGPARLITVASLAPSSWAAVLARHDLRFDGSGGAARCLPGRQPDQARVRAFVAERVGHLLGQGGVPVGIGADQAVESDVSTRMVTDIALACCALPRARLTCPVTAVRALDDALVDPDAVAGWAQATSADCVIVNLAGGHFLYRVDPRPLAALLAGEADAIDGAYGAF